MATETKTTNTAKSNTTPKNGGTDQTTPDKKPVTVMITENLHRKAKITAELSGTSLSDLVEEQIRVIVRERLPGLLSKLDTEG